MHVRSTRAIRAGEELTSSYIDLFAKDRHTRRTELSELYHFVCEV